MLVALVIVMLLIGLFVLAPIAYFLFLQRRYREPAHAHEIHRVTTEDGWKLRLHRRKPEREAGDPIFFMHSLSSNHLNFEIPHGYSLVDYLVKHGYDCWTFDSRACRDAVPPRRGVRMKATVDDLLTKDIPAALKLAGELLEASERRGGAVKKREETHRMAEANKAFSHFRW